MSYYPPKAEVTPNTVFLSIIDESFKLKTYPMYITGTGIDGYFKN
ncbi:hypothetical protein [Pedobacter cryoconitis]|uniref:Uncharacterized protein n=1 Tax=Pedobacter cryoconitis TaxID=188932 RepID=A0A327T989_9SPHI|nr:hypothetical protein [Pedobacter cryoconitis]RAJ36935.1 hypothetical protein LY11_00010 [Pedobacter cryoconitis]